jgi:hypothetical protein
MIPAGGESDSKHYGERGFGAAALPCEYGWLAPDQPAVD